MPRDSKILLRTSVLMTFWLPASANQIFVSLSGNDLNPGTIDQPYLTISMAHSVAAAGDTIYVRGGVFVFNVTVTLSKNGSSVFRFSLFSYEDERPILDFSSMVVGSSNRGMRISGDYWHVRGFDIKGAGDNGMHISGSYNIVEFCSFYENRDTGLQLSGGASNNQIINCDSYANADPSQGNADGFAPKLDVGTGNYFFGCRAWQNSDDGWDGYLRGANNVSTVLENCWAFKNGYLGNGAPSSGNGNGFKLGGSDTANLSHNVILRNCLAFDNRVKGFDQNHNRGSMTLYNCIGTNNGTNYSISETLAAGMALTLANCSVLGTLGSLGVSAVQQTNSWQGSFVVTGSDFISIDTLGVRGPRNADGSLPDLGYLHLAQGSDLIDGGTDVGLPYNGSAPDLGAFESEPLTSAVAANAIPTSFELRQNYPNPFNPSTTLVFEIPAAGNVSARVYDITGRVVATLADRDYRPGMHTLRWDGTDMRGVRLATGIYLVMMRFQEETQSLKVQLLN